MVQSDTQLTAERLSCVVGEFLAVLSSVFPPHFPMHLPIFFPVHFLSFSCLFCCPYFPGLCAPGALGGSVEGADQGMGGGGGGGACLTPHRI